MNTISNLYLLLSLGSSYVQIWLSSLEIILFMPV